MLLVIGLLACAGPAASRQEKAAEDPAATRLLKDARAARALWEKFPGFSANVRINHNGQVINTHLQVQDNGKLTFDIADPDTKKFVRQQLASLVGHRLPGGTEKATPCAFADKNEDHPQGRKIVVLGDKMGSSYRVKDNQLLEVNRGMKGSRFTITVLKNDVTPEKKYLASQYVVHTWKNGGNELLDSTTFHHTWKRVNGLDLPDTLTIVIARAGTPPTAGPEAPKGATESTLDTWTFTFSNQQLLPWK